MTKRNGDHDAAARLEEMRRKGRERQARYYEKHGREKRTEYGKRRRAAERTLVGRHEGEYAELLALHRESKNATRDARAELAKRYPDEWRDILAAE